MAIDFAVGGQRQRVKNHEGSRHHVLWEPGPKVTAQFSACGGAFARHKISDERFEILDFRSWIRNSGFWIVGVARQPFARDDNAFTDGGMFGQYRFNFFRLDPVAANLDLIVEASEKLDVAVRQVAGAVACPVQTARRLAIEAMGDEFLRRQLRLVQIPTRHSSAPNVNLSEDAHRHRLKVGVEYINLRIGDRPPDWNH